MKTAILFILMLILLIAPHELGHFIVAKLCNVQVNEFSIGMGPLIWKKKKGETQYSLRLIPLGGYNAMEGEEGSSDNPRAFNNQTPLKKLAILIAGVVMNMLLALIISVIAVSISGVPINTIESVEVDSPAAIAGIEAGDKIIEIDGNKTDSWLDVTSTISSYQEGDRMEILVKRDGEKKTFFLVPQFSEETQRYTIGIVAKITKNPIITAPYGVQYAWLLNTTMIESFRMMFAGQLTKDDVAGPVGLVKVVDQTAEAGLTSYLILLALISLNLAFINLLPIPGLDGGKILFVLLKLITRGKINDDMEAKATFIGFVLLIMIFIYITINDVNNLIH